MTVESGPDRGLCSCSLLWLLLRENKIEENSQSAVSAHLSVTDTNTERNNTMKRSHSDNDTLTLTVVHVTKTATESYVETVSRTETVFALKTKVQKHIHLSPSFMRLIYKGGTWDDSNLVSAV